ncbi:MAG TPA: GntR family transcriptional regulator [Planctomycetota bacterium]|jgi:GntR family transcriptional regulator
MRLDTASPVPLYQQLQDILRGEILARTHVPGGKLPSEHELCRTYGVTRPTVRQALEGLVREGLVRKHRGKGAFVTEPPSPVGLFSMIGTSDALREQKLRLETKVLHVERVSSCMLTGGSNPPGGWVMLERMRRVNGVAAFYEYDWLHALLVPGIDRLNLENCSLLHLLADQYKLRMDGGRQRFSAVVAPAHIAQALEVRPGAPLFRAIRNVHLIRTPGAASVLSIGRANDAMVVDFYAAQGPFVLEQVIPPQGTQRVEILQTAPVISPSVV